MAAENALQEVKIDLGGKSYLVRPNWRALLRIEAATGQGIRQLGIKCLALGDLRGLRGEIPEISLTEMVTVLFAILSTEDGAPKSADDVGEALFEEGYSQHAGTLGDYLLRAFKGNKEHEKEALKEAAKPKESPRKAAA